MYEKFPLSPLCKAMAWRSLHLCRSLSRSLPHLPNPRAGNPTSSSLLQSRNSWPLVAVLPMRSHSDAAQVSPPIGPTKGENAGRGDCSAAAFSPSPSRSPSPSPSSLNETEVVKFAAVADKSHSDAAPVLPPIGAAKDGSTGGGGRGAAGSAPFGSSLNEAEVAKFAAIAETWWDFEGPFKPLHLMNPTRISFIRSTLCRHFRKDPYCARPFEGLKIIDVGCGGGILSEPLARMGATVTGIDAVEKNIKIACVHAGSDPLTSSIEYDCTTAEQMVRENKKFDAVISLEVIEHVADPLEFCKSLAALTVPGGATVISTINRSVRSYAAAIVAAEYLLNWLPKGTHQWSSFLTPEELVLILQRASISVQEMAGFVYNPLTGEWSLSEDTSVNFIVFGSKEAD